SNHNDLNRLADVSPAKNVYDLSVFRIIRLSMIKPNLRIKINYYKSFVKLEFIL
ncbi:Hypothetical protein FKW44_021654, partial [Caligus rogercresseyi]